MYSSEFAVRRVELAVPLIVVPILLGVIWVSYKLRPAGVDTTTALGTPRLRITWRTTLYTVSICSALLDRKSVV